MAITSNTYTGNGSNKLFSITFPYIDTTDVDVYLNGAIQTVTTQYTFANATTIEFVAAPGAGTTVLLSRSSDDTTLQATFFPGSSIKANDLNNNFDQVLYLAQETNNNVANAVAGQIPDGTITSSKIADGAIINADVNASAGIAATKLAFTQSGAGATARTIDSKLKEVVSVKDFGAVGDGTTNDSAAIQAAAAAAVAAGARLWIPKTSSFYAVSSTAISVTLANGQGLVIESDGAELRRNINSGGSIINAACTSSETAALGTNTFLVVRGLTLDGRGVPEQWTETNPANLVTLTAISTSVEYLTIQGCRFNKIYGYGINSGGAYQSEVSNCSFNEVGGHWYQNNTYDAFGDGVYHRKVKANGNILISNCNIIGYASNYSRIGITFEYSTGNYYNATVSSCLVQKYDRAIHIEEDSSCQLTVNDCKLIDFRVGIFLFLTLASSNVTVNNSYLRYGSGDYNGSQGWSTYYNASGPITFNNCFLTVASGGFVSNAGPDARYNNCIIDYNSQPSILSNHSAVFTGCQFRNIVAPGGANHYFFSGTQRFRECRFYGTANVTFNRSSSTNFEEVVDCISYGPILSTANLTRSLEYYGVTTPSSQLLPGVQVTNGTTLYLPATYNIFPNTDGWNGYGSGNVQNAPRTFTASSTTVPSAIWSNLSKAVLIAKFSDGSAPYVMRSETFWDPTAYGRGYYAIGIKRSTSGAWVSDGTVTTYGTPSAAGFDGSTSNGFIWTGVGGFAWICEVLIIPRHASTYIL